MIHVIVIPFSGEAPGQLALKTLIDMLTNLVSVSGDEITPVILSEQDVKQGIAMNLAKNPLSGNVSLDFNHLPNLFVQQSSDAEEAKSFEAAFTIVGEAFKNELSNKAVLDFCTNFSMALPMAHMKGQIPFIAAVQKLSTPDAFNHLKTEAAVRYGFRKEHLRIIQSAYQKYVQD